MLKTINDKSQLRQVYTDPKGVSLEKTQYRLDEHCHRFIAASPFLILGTHGDVFPRGDHPGFVKVLDDNTLIISDRKGNNRLDSMSNILAAHINRNPDEYNTSYEDNIKMLRWKKGGSIINE